MKLLSGLNDRIITSNIHPPQGVLLTSVQLFSENIGDLISIGDQLSKLSYQPELTLNVVDFDDTIYGRYEQLQYSIFQDNRGEDGNRLLRETIGFRKFVERFYTRSGAVQRILGVVESQTDRHKSLILTTGMRDLQEMKVDSINISRKNVPVITVNNSKDKPRMLLDHIIHTLGYIPGKIIIYEDRPECFEAEILGLRQLLPRTEIVIDKITLNPPGNLRQIGKIEQDIYPRAFS